MLTFFAAHLPRFQMSLKADGLDVEEDVQPKFVLTVEGSSVFVDTKLIIQGPVIGTNTTGQEAEGPHCVGAGGG